MLRKTGSVFLRFSIHLHKRDFQVLESINSYFKSFQENKDENKNIIIRDKSVNLQITKLLEIKNIIIPFFNSFPILGVKSLDFEDFKKIQVLIADKKYLKDPLLYNKVMDIKLGMNLNRKKYF